MRAPSGYSVTRWMKSRREDVDYSLTKLTNSHGENATISHTKLQQSPSHGRPSNSAKFGTQILPTRPPSRDSPKHQVRNCLYSLRATCTRIQPFSTRKNRSFHLAMTYPHLWPQCHLPILPAANARPPFISEMPSIATGRHVYLTATALS